MGRVAQFLHSHSTRILALVPATVGVLLVLASVGTPAACAKSRDRTAPVTKASVGSGWTTVTTVKLKAADKGGVRATYYRFGSGAIKTYKKPFAIAEGVTTLKFWSVDKAKNKEKQRTLVLHVDRSAPRSVSSVDGPQLWITGSKSVRLGAYDAGSGLAGTYYRVGSGAARSYTAPFTIRTEGITRIVYWSVDRLGHAEQPRTAYVKIDIGEPAGETTAAARAVTGATTSAQGASASGLPPVGFMSVHSPTAAAGPVAAADPAPVVSAAAPVVTRAVSAGTIQNATVHFAQAGLVTTPSPTSRNPDCLNCHSSESIPASGVVNFRVGLIDRTTTCAKCHVAGLAGTHPYHNTTANCGAICHAGWGQSLTSAIPNVATPYGAFASAASKDATSGLLHVIHGAARWPAGVDVTDSRCASCHAAAACDSCHNSAAFPIDPTHSNHGATGDAQYPAQPSVTRTVGYGVPGGDQSVLTAITKTEQCSTPACHNTAGLHSATPLIYDDHTHVANPALNYASNTVTTTGTWVQRANAAYSMGTARYSVVASSTLSVTAVGIQAAWVGQTGPDCGIGAILVDGVQQATVDCYAPTTTFGSVLWTSGTLAPGPHALTVKALGTRNASAWDSKVYVDKFLAWQAVPGLIAPLCTSCHPDRTQMHGYDATQHATLPTNAACTDCHTGALGDIHSAATTTVAGVVRTGCDVCHYGGVVPASKDCSSCHGAAPHPTTAAFCYTCHTSALRTYPGKTAVLTSAHMTALSSSVASVQYPGTSYGPQNCANCHQGHSGQRASGDDLCYACHDAAGTNKPANYSYQGQAGFANSGHAGNGCESCHYVHGTSTLPTGQSLVPRDDSICLTCHNNPGNSNNGVDIAAAFNADSNPISHHDIAGVTGSTSNGLTCESCHNPHISSPSNPVVSANAKGQLFDTTSEVPADSVERTEYEVDLPITENVTLDSGDPNGNQGGDSTIYVDSDRNGLLKVDDSQLPPDSYITSAELRVYAPADQRTDTIIPHLLTDPTWDGWSEWNATWNQYGPGVPWGQFWNGWSYQNILGGADETNWEQMWGSSSAGNGPYGPFSQSSFSSMAPDDPWVTLDVTTDMQAIYRRQNKPYTGILLKADNPDAKLYFTSNHGDSSQVPYVHVTYYRTSMLIDANADTAFNRTQPSDTYGSSTRITVDANSAMLVNFDLADVPSNATITDVKLKLYCQQGGGQYPGDGSFTVYKVMNSWDENGSPGRLDLGDVVTTLHPDDYQWYRTDDQWLSFDGKAILDALSDPNVHGLAIVAEQGDLLDVTTREYDDWHAPKLEVQYSYADTLPAAQNSISYCTQCHGDNIPSGIGPISPINGLDSSLAFQYDFHNSHGQQLAMGTASRPEFDWDASLKDPYFYGMGPLQCSDCHDPHGSSNLFHLKENINGSTGLTVSDQWGNDSSDVEQWCGACHNFTPHEWWGPDCLGCHYHGRNTSRRF